MNRKRLSKLIGKLESYTGKIDEIKDDNMCIVDVCHNGKVVADHLWISRSKYCTKLVVNTEIIFTGIVHTYKDKHGSRKLGIHSCHSFIRLVGECMKLVEIEENNFKKRNYKG